MIRTSTPAAKHRTYRSWKAALHTDQPLDYSILVKHTCREGWFARACMDSVQSGIGILPGSMFASNSSLYWLPYATSLGRRCGKGTAASALPALIVSLRLHFATRLPNVPPKPACRPHSVQPLREGSDSPIDQCKLMSICNSLLIYGNVHIPYTDLKRRNLCALEESNLC